MSSYEQCLEDKLNVFAEEIIKKETPEIKYMPFKLELIEGKYFDEMIRGRRLRATYDYRTNTITSEKDAVSLHFFHELAHHIQKLEEGEGMFQYESHYQIEKDAKRKTKKLFVRHIEDLHKLINKCRKEARRSW